MSDEYKNIVFISVRAPSKVVSTHNVENTDQYNEMIQNAKNKKIYIYYSTIVDNQPSQPWMLDWNSIAQDTEPKLEEPIYKEPKEEIIEEEIIEEEPEPENPLKCPHCSTVCKSKSGITNHIKSKHKDLI